MRALGFRRDTTARIAAVGAALLWATVGVAGRLAPHGTSPAALSEARLLVGGGALISVLGPARVLRSLAAAPRRLVLTAVLGMAVFQWTFFAAVDGAGAGAAAVLSAAGAPLAADALEARRGRTRLRAGWWLAAFALVAGGALASTPQTSRLAIFVGLAAGVSYALYADAAAALAHARPCESAGLTITAIALAGGAVALGPAAVTHLHELASARGLLVAAYLGLPATALAYGLFAAGLARLGAADGLGLVLVQPLAALALEWLLLGRTLEPLVVAGLALAGAAPLLRLLEPGGRTAGRATVPVRSAPNPCAE